MLLCIYQIMWHHVPKALISIGPTMRTSNHTQLTPWLPNTHSEFLATDDVNLEQWFSTQAMCHPRGPHSISKGTQVHDRKSGGPEEHLSGAPTLHYSNNIFQISNWIKGSPLPCICCSTEDKVLFYSFSNILSDGIWFQLGNLFAVKSTQPPWCCEERRTSLITDHTRTVHSKTCNC
jgi:hypothetical protein